MVGYGAGFGHHRTPVVQQTGQSDPGCSKRRLYGALLLSVRPTAAIAARPVGYSDPEGSKSHLCGALDAESEVGSGQRVTLSRLVGIGCSKCRFYGALLPSVRLAATAAVHPGRLVGSGVQQTLSSVCLHI